MNAAQIFQYSNTMIAALGPAILITAIVANANILLDLIYGLFRRVGRNNF